MNALNPQSNIALTPAGKAYALAHVRPAGCPDGVDPVKWRKAIERRCQKLADTLQGLIALLDGIDLDADLEPTLGASEPQWTGGFGPARGLSQKRWSDGSTEDGEGEDAGDDEPSLGNSRQYNPDTGRIEEDLELDPVDQGEPTLGAPDHIMDQEHWNAGGSWTGEGEDDGEDFGIDDEPHDPDTDLEYSLGWPTMTESTCQGIGWTAAGHKDGDLEVDLTPVD